MAPKFTTIFASLAALAFTTQAAPFAPAPTQAAAAKQPGAGIGVFISNVDAKDADIVPNSYIVVYNNTFSDDDIDTHQLTVKTTIAKRNLNKRALDGRTLSTQVNTFSMSGWRAMALDADDLMMSSINAESVVSYVEANTYVKVSALQMQNNAPDGLARISHAKAGVAGYVFDDSAGAGITAYVVDTGILTTHDEFQGRATLAFNAVNNVVSKTR